MSCQGTSDFLKFLIVNADYTDFLSHLYAQHPGLARRSYQEQIQVRADSLFGSADFYSSNLRKLGHEAWDIRVNNEFVQRAWAREHNISASPSYVWRFRLRRGVLPWLYQVKVRRWLTDILAAQIKYFQPDILLNLAMDSISSQFWKEFKSDIRLLVGQIAAPLPEGEDWSCYDLVISSLDNFVEFFQRQGIPSERHRLGFEPRVLDRLDQPNKSIPVSFVGGLSRAHVERVTMLENLCRRVDLRIWGMIDASLPTSLRRCYQGPAWGYDVYRILHDSKLTLNEHGKWAGPYANNLRLYEATGVGTLLVTDWKTNLHEMFEPGKELVTFRSAEECVEVVQYYLEHSAERECIAKAGQQRTLRDHTYYQRMQELVHLLGKYI